MKATTVPASRLDHERLKAIRVKLGLSQEAFGVKLGYTRAMISAVERGDAEPSVTYLRKLASVFGVDLRTIWCP